MDNRPLFHHLDLAEEHARLTAIRAQIEARLRELADTLNPDAPPFDRLGRVALIAALADGAARG